MTFVMGVIVAKRNRLDDKVPMVGMAGMAYEAGRRFWYLFFFRCRSPSLSGSLSKKQLIFYQIPGINENYFSKKKRARHPQSLLLHLSY